MSNVAEKIERRKRSLRLVLIVLFGVILLFAAVGVYLLTLWQNGRRLNRETMFVSKQTQQITFERTQETPNAAIKTPVPVTPPPGGDTPAVRHGGKYYVLNEDVLCILFLGVDVTGSEQFQSIGVTAHQTDSLILAAIDPVAGKLSMINIPRMTVTEVKQLDAAFRYARTTRSPICIQYAFGDGKALSCELTREAVGNLLFNIPINRYVAMNLDGLFAANDAIGGVTLTLLDDMTAFHPDMKKGETYTLTGKTAQIYVARRLGKGLDGTNLSRAKRQVQYYKAFFQAAKSRLKEDPLFAVNLYRSLGSSIQTDLTLEEISYLSQTVVGMELMDENVHTLQGTVKNEDYFVDDEALKALLIEVFYTEVAA